MGWSTPPPAALPPTQQLVLVKVQEIKKNGAGTQQNAAGQGESTMLTEGAGIDPSLLGKKTLLGG